MIKIFTGYDPREAAGWHVCFESLMEHSSDTVEIIPITERLSGGGSNSFTRSRFMIAERCGYRGWAAFIDGADMMFRSDPAELWAHRMLGGKDVWCVKHSYQTQHARKYIGTPMEADNSHYYRKNWASLFLLDCGSNSAKRLTREYVEQAPILDLLQFKWVDSDLIGAVQAEWNWLIGEYGKNERAKLAHYTLGIPGFEHYKDADFADEWRSYSQRANKGA